MGRQRPWLGWDVTQREGWQAPCASPTRVAPGQHSRLGPGVQCRSPAHTAASPWPKCESRAPELRVGAHPGGQCRVAATGPREGAVGALCPGRPDILALLAGWGGQCVWRSRRETQARESSSHG